MNEHIKELMIQAGTDSSGKWLGIDNVEKLTELIAKQCMDIIVQNREYASQHKWPATELANVCLYEIHKTFGVNQDGKKTVFG